MAGNRLCRKPPRLLRQGHQRPDGGKAGFLSNGMASLLSLCHARPQFTEWMARAFIVLLAFLFAVPALAEKGKLRERLTPEVMAVVYPGEVERLGPEEGSPPAIAVYQGDKVVAWVFSTLDIIAAPGYTT